MIPLSILLAALLSIFVLAASRCFHPNGLSFRAEWAYLWHGILVWVQRVLRPHPHYPLGIRLRELTKEAHAVWHPEYLEKVRLRRWR